MNRRRLLSVACAGLLIVGGGTAHADEEELPFDAELVMYNDGTTGLVSASGFDSGGAASEHRITRECSFTTRAVNNSATYTIYASATSGPHNTPVSTGVRCELRRGDGSGWACEGAQPGSQVSIACTFEDVLRGWTICVRGNATWNDNHSKRTKYACK